jgi:outer membrane protein
MNSSALKALFLAAAMSLAVTHVQAQELKIGYVYLDRVLRDATPAKAALAKLEVEFGKREKDLADMANRLKAASDKLEKDGPTLADSERTRRGRDLIEQEREFQRKRREFQEDLNERRNAELAGVIERANRAIKVIFETEKYDLILQEAVFASPKIDITDKVIKSLNAQPAGAK